MVDFSEYPINKSVFFSGAERKEEVIIEFKYIASLVGMLNEYKVLGEKKYLSIVNREQLLLKLMNSWKTI